MEASDLNATAKVILGLLDWQPRSGYEIKQLVDNSTRFFWSASYGQIYPELKRLEKEGLVEGKDKTQGARARTVYKLTRKGKRALHNWLEEPPATYELRDEGLLKLFLSGGESGKRSAEIARQRAVHSAEVARRLREIEQDTERKDMPAYTVLRYGIEMNEWVAEWFEAAAQSLESDDAPTLILKGTGS